MNLGYGASLYEGEKQDTFGCRLLVVPERIGKVTPNFIRHYDNLPV
ncbi:3737_t:CDS:2 [Dentiscutata erythropus]|uniref:3737_t:CDS:1 n=1 Tax=Dentiscutata erythropus TaxID=1348616 RepID=A0A9N8YMR3_9GLOM|nr:3737_t:CDS:2 [Dentiscutata erythropus]